MSKARSTSETLPTLFEVDRAEPLEKFCTKCERTLPFNKFWNHPSGKNGKHSHCIDCKNDYIAEWRQKNRDRIRQDRKARYEAMTPEQLEAKRDYQNRQYRENSWRWKRDRLMKRYGMTLADYDAMELAQGGRCAICGGEPGKKGLHVDHSHATGVVRGLLCSRCNTGLGQFKDDPARLVRAIGYLIDTQ